VRLRVAARAATRDTAALIGDEVEALYTNGPRRRRDAQGRHRADRHRVDAGRPRARAAATTLFQR
jgi:hypothetical protein